MALLSWHCWSLISAFREFLEESLVPDLWTLMMVLKNGIRIVSLTLLAIHVDPAFFMDDSSSRWGRILFSSVCCFSRLFYGCSSAAKPRLPAKSRGFICAERKQNSTRLK